MFHPITALDPQRRASLEAELNRAAQACPVLRYGEPALRPLVHGRGLPHATTGGADLWPRFACYYERLTHLPRRTRRALQRQWRRSLAAIALLLALGQAPALAATINVAPGTAPDINPDRLCALIEALENANADAATHGDCIAGRGADTIRLPAGSTQTLTAVHNTILEGAAGLPLITSNITIQGRNSTITRQASAPEFRIVSVNENGNLTFNRATVSGGAYSGEYGGGGGVRNFGTLTLTNSTVSGNYTNEFGGGVANSGTLTLTSSTVSGNFTDGAGGGVLNDGSVTLTDSTVSGNYAPSGGGVFNANYGSVTLTDSTVSGNTARSSGGGVDNHGDLAVTNSTMSGNYVGSNGSGGGVLNHNYGSVTLTDSTVSGNYATYGGGIANLGTATLTNSTVSGNTAGSDGGGVHNYFHGTLSVTNSTVSGNSAGGTGGGVHNSYRFYGVYYFLPTVILTNSTVSGNTAGSYGGGVYNKYAPLTLSRTLVLGNAATAGPEVQNERGTLTANNYNLFGTDGDAGIVGFTPGATDIVPTAGVTLTDILAPLADNGGSTETHALVAGSPAIDAAGPDCPPPETDQRGVPRPQGAACDIGSFEVMAAPAPDLAVSKADSPDPVLISDHLRYTVTVNNAGQGEATGVILTDTLPASVDFVSVRPSDGCAESGGVLTCALGTLASGEKARVTIVVKPTATGRITNRVAVASAETDENPENNTDTEKTTVKKLRRSGPDPRGHAGE